MKKSFHYYRHDADQKYIFVCRFCINSQADEFKVLEFDTMVGVPRPFTGAVNPIRGVPGGGLPWVISFGKGELSPAAI